jgi:hypothetical protein
VGIVGGQGVRLGTPLVTNALEIRGNICNLNVPMAMNEKTIYLRTSGNESHRIVYNSDLDGIEVLGYRGVRLRAFGAPIAIEAKADVVNINVPMAMNDKAIFLRDVNTSTHQIIYNGDAQQVSIFGGNGVRLGTTLLKNALEIKGNVNEMNVPLLMNKNAILLSLIRDYSHRVAYNSSFDGVEMMGYNGVRLGVNGKPIVIEAAINVVNIYSPMAMNEQSIFLKSIGNAAHQIKYDSDLDGVGIFGTKGVRLGTTAFKNIADIRIDSVNINTTIAMNRNPIFLKEISDTYHQVTWDSTIDGVGIFGYNGVTLGTFVRKNMMVFDPLKIKLNAHLVTNDNTIYLQDNLNHGIRHGGLTFDGPSIFGINGVALGTVAEKKALYFSGNTTVINNQGGPALIVRKDLMNRALWDTLNPYGAGLQIGWNNKAGTGGTDFIANLQAGAGRPFAFYYMNTTLPTPQLICQLLTDGSFSILSDYRIKSNVAAIDPSFTVDSLRPVTYNLRDNNTVRNMGFIAHEVQEVFPMLVSGEKDGEERQTLNYTGLIPVLVAEVQRLKAQNQALQSQIDRQQSQIDKLFTLLV